MGKHMGPTVIIQDLTTKGFEMLCWALPLMCLPYITTHETNLSGLGMRREYAITFLNNLQGV